MNKDSQIINQPCRLSAAMLLNRAKAVAHVEGIEAGFRQVEELCAGNKDFKNPRSQLAWMLFLDKRMTHEEVIPYFEKDRQQGRLIAEYLLTYAESLAAVGREADAGEAVRQSVSESVVRHPSRSWLGTGASAPSTTGRRGGDRRTS